jgi:chloramphenicol-sensitive protein RarD
MSSSGIVGATSHARPDVTEERRGLMYGLAAYGLWGIVPVFWKQIAHVDPVEQLGHRVVWGFAVLAVLVWILGRGEAVVLAVRDRRVVGMMVLSGALLAVNWGVFVYAVATDQLLDASLGYFINPLVSVGLGTIVLRERLGRLQSLAIVIALIGVGLMTWHAGRLPWIAVVVSTTFGSYGLVRKTARVDTLVGSTIETAVILPVALAYLLWLTSTSGPAFLGVDRSTDLLLIATGVITAGPLLLFTAAARRLPLATIGFLQYLAPSGQFLLAVLVYGEPFAAEQLAAFACIWIALAVFSIEMMRARHSSRPG